MRSTDDIARRGAPLARGPAVSVDLRLALDGGGARLPWRAAASTGAAPVVDAVRALAERITVPGAFVLDAGAADAPAGLWPLLAALAERRPAGLGLGVARGLTPALAAEARAAGVTRVLVPFHCARQDAHDWLVGAAGALKHAHRVIRAGIEADLPVTAEIVVTRPTAAHLAETVEVLARVGVRSIVVRRLLAQDTRGAEFVALSPRLALLTPHLERAAAVALERRVRIRLRDLPLCVAPRLRPLFASPDSERWVLPDGQLAARSVPDVGCATCPGPPACAGAPADYVARFGWEELTPGAPAERVHESIATQQVAQAPLTMAFTWPGPPRVRCAACGDGAADRAATTRAIRARLVTAARYRPAMLRLVGAELLAHPDAARLLYDALRLFPHVEVAGEGSALAEWSDLDVRRLKDLRRLDVALYGPDAASHDAHCGIPGAFAAMQRGVQRVRARAGLRVGGYAILHDAQHVPAFAAAWDAGHLPGEPRFRLAARGGSLDELVAAALALPAGRTRTALLAVLPRCLTGEPAGTPAPGGDAAAPIIIRYGRPTPYAPCGTDPHGVFEPCPASGSCTGPDCPGRPIGWHSTERTQRWSGSR